MSTSRRELVAGCLRALYERLHGPSADHSINLTREALKDLLLPVIREYQEYVAPDAVPDELLNEDVKDPSQMASVVLKLLLQDGWLEQFPDRHGLVTAFRFSRPGKVFAEAFWSLSRPNRSRQRNMRGCRNALDAALRPNGDAHDLMDAYEYAEKVVEDLNESIKFLQERLRLLMQEASLHDQWDEFVEFLDRFQREYSKQLTVDSATLNRNAIRSKLEELRDRLSDNRRQRMEEQLRDIVLSKQMLQVPEHSTLLNTILDKIEDMVNAALEARQPEFMHVMDTYIKRVTGLVQQSMMLRTGRDRHAYLEAVSRLAKRDTAGQDRLLGLIGQQLAAVEVRLLDPSSFKIRTAAQRRKASTVSVAPRASREARLAAAQRRAETEAFALANEELTERLRKDLRLLQRPVRLSELPESTARDLLSKMQAVEASRNTRFRDLVAKRLPMRVENEFYSGYDYEIDFKRTP